MHSHTLTLYTVDNQRTNDAAFVVFRLAVGLKNNVEILSFILLFVSCVLLGLRRVLKI